MVEELSQSEQLLISEFIRRKHSNIRGISVIKNDKEIFKSYYARSSENDKFNVASVTKSVISLLIGIAIDEGYIDSVDEKVMSFFPEYEFSDNNKLRKEITIKNLLTMTAPFPFPNMREPLGRICSQKDWVEYGLKIMGTGGRVGTFKYSTIGAHILSAIITKTTKMSAREFANEHLFLPLGMNEIENFEMKYDIDHIFGKKMKGWVSDPLGNNSGGWGLTLTLDDMSRLGELCLKNGKINSSQIISESWLNDATIPVKNIYGNYGYLWWIRENKDGFMATGSGGNIIYINRNQNIVITIAATIISKHVDRQKLIDYLLTMIKDK